MKGRIAQRFFYDRVKPSVRAAMEEYTTLTGRQYDLISCYRMDDAEYAFVGLGSMMETAQGAVDEDVVIDTLLVVAVAVYRDRATGRDDAQMKRRRDIADHPIEDGRRHRLGVGVGEVERAGEMVGVVGW